MDKLTGGDFATQQDDDEIPFNLDDIEVSYVGDDGEEAGPAPKQRMGQNEDPDFFEGDTGDDDEEEFNNASQAVKNRIMRERRLRMEAEARVNERLTELEKAEEGILQSERKAAAAQRDSFKIGLDALDVRMQHAREALKESRVSEDRGAEVEIEAHIREIERLRGEIQNNLARIPSDEQIIAGYQQHREKVGASRRQVQGTDVGRPLNNLAQRWAGQNAWMDDPRNSKAKENLVAVSQQIALEGLDPNSQEHFTELTRRMAKSFPALGVRDLAGRQLGASRGQPQGQRRSSAPPPVGGNRGGQPPVTQGSKPNSKRVNLDLDDRKMMRAVGIDPSDKKAAAYFAKEKLARLTRESQGRR
jgi:hypothetical protein